MLMRHYLVCHHREVLAYILSLPKEKWIHGFRFCSECDDKDGNSKNNKGIYILYI